MSKSSLRPGVDFTFTWDNNNNNNNNNDKNPQLNLFTGTVLGDKEQGVRDKEGIRPKWSLTLKTIIKRDLNSSDYVIFFSLVIFL